MADKTTEIPNVVLHSRAMALDVLGRAFFDMGRGKLADFCWHLHDEIRKYLGDE